MTKLRTPVALSGSLCIATLALAACSSGSPGSAAGNPAPITHASGVESSSSQDQNLAPQATAPSETTQPLPEPTNLVANGALRQQLLAAFTAFRSDAANAPGLAAIPPSAEGGITPGTLYYALDRATGTYWAVATFSATKAASRTTAYVGFQDGGNRAVFTRSAGGQWRVKSVGACLRGLPVTVADKLTLTASSSPMCPNGVPAS